MAFFIASSPHVHQKHSTSDLMRWVMIAACPGFIAQIWFFGWGTLIQLVFACLLALTFEGLMMKLRQRPVSAALQDHSALVTAWLLAVAIPPLSPWWIIFIGLLFAIVVAKQLYGGMGQNPFNPAMIGYVVLLVSFPLQMTSWMPPHSLLGESQSFRDALHTIFTGFNTHGLSLQQIRAGIDGVTMATPLDAVKTAVRTGSTASEAVRQKQFGLVAGLGWEVVNLAYLLGGLLLLRLKIIQWYIPISFLASVLVMSQLSRFIAPDAVASPLVHLFSGATMLGAFFIATDPVSAATTIKGRLIFGAFIGFMVVIIRNWGGYPDGVAFSVLLANMCVPLIDHFTKPRTYGH